MLFIVGCGTPDKSAPNVEFRLLDGQRVMLKELAGRTVLLNFWASTCHTCLEEMPELNRLFRDYRDKPFSLISIAMFYDPPNRVVETQHYKNIEFPVSLDINRKIATAFGNIEGTPTFILIDKTGNIVEHKLGRWDNQRLRQQIDALLAKNHPAVDVN